LFNPWGVGGNPPYRSLWGNPPYRQLVGKTRWVFRQPHGLSTEWDHTGHYSQLDGNNLDWTHSADGRPSGSSLQAVEQMN
jgi:hypothetical protein